MIKEIYFAQLDKANMFFKATSKVDPADVPKRFAKYVMPARKLVEENCSVAITCDWFKLDEVPLTGEMPARVFAGCDRVLCYVATLRGYEELCKSEELQDEMLLSFFVDSWGRAFVEAATTVIGDLADEEAKDCGGTRTHSWCPGQHNFDLSNQRVLFALLKPEEIGCTLSDSLLMHPIKSASGVVGVMTDGEAELIKPCDFCPHTETCPSHKCSAI